MAQAYECQDCGLVTDEPIKHLVRECDGLDCAPYRVSVELECPDCSSDDLEPVQLCRRCGYFGVWVAARVGDLCLAHADQEKHPE